MILFSADLYLLTKEEGGRRTPVKSDTFRTDIRFKDGARFCSITFDSDFMHPGETRRVAIDVLLHGVDEIDYLLSLNEWLLFDGQTNIGRVINVKLAADQEREKFGSM